MDAMVSSQSSSPPARAQPFAPLQGTGIHVRGGGTCVVDCAVVAGGCGDAAEGTPGGVDSQTRALSRPAHTSWSATRQLSPCAGRAWQPGLASATSASRAMQVTGRTAGNNRSRTS
jgi:hypothetical protein